MDNPTRPMLWSIRRELWENRSVYLAPLIVAAVVLFGSLVATMRLPKKIRTIPAEPAKLVTALKPFQIAPSPIMLTAFIVGVFYALDAMYGERRDRSILFWKSLPVSDRTTVLSKAAIPLFVLPLIALVLSIAVVFVLLFFGTLALISSGISMARLWGDVIGEVPIMLYGLTVHTLWFAPIYCWLFLISAWAKRAPFLWAILPPFAIGAAERMATGASRFGRFMTYRVTGAMERGFVTNPKTHEILGISPLEFLLTPGLWLGLIFAAACLVAAVRLRRNREPI